MGNSLDRALLLATLLQRAGHTVRLAHGEYSEEQAGAMLPDLVALRPSQSIGPVIESAAVSSDIRGVAAQYRFMGTELEGTIRAGSDHLAQIAWEARHRVDDQVRRLARRVGRLSEPSQDFARRLDAATDALRDHWWVQERDGDAWIDYDVLTSRPGAPEMRPIT
jgi:hypothetical protein